MIKITLLLITNIVLLSIFSNAQKPREFYQVTVYHFNSPEQENSIDTYLKEAYITALRKKGIKNIGIFKPLTNDTSVDKRIYVIMPLKTLHQIIDIPDQLSKDKQYLQTGNEYIDAVYKNPPYTRMENIILKAFQLAPVMNLPKLTGDRKERIYELRSYEGPTEKLYKNKVQMFNQGGEISLFSRLNFNAVFYAEVIAGCRMPNLMYMTSFENKADRDAHWKTFSADPEWKKISALPEYQNNVSRNETILMHATDYSDY
jgi:hypothetical protein